MTTQIHSTVAPAREGSVRTVEDLRGPAGRLEALLNPSRRSAPPRAAVLLCHPHPLFGGTVHNKVVYHAMKTFTDLGLPVLRFNFRGAGSSEGMHAYGQGEQDDARAGLDWLDREYKLPIVAAGFSFGAHMALRAGAPDPRVTALVSLGTPVQVADRAYGYDFLSGVEKPILFLSGSVDEFGPVAEVESAIDAASLSHRQISWIPGADHFFVGKLDLMQGVLRDWVQAQGLAAGESSTGDPE